MVHSHQHAERSSFQEVTKTCYFKLEKCLMIVTLILFCFIFIPILVLDILRYKDSNNKILCENGTRTIPASGNWVTNTIVVITPSTKMPNPEPFKNESSLIPRIIDTTTTVKADIKPFRQQSVPLEEPIIKLLQKQSPPLKLQPKCKLRGQSLFCYNCNAKDVVTIINQIVTQKNIKNIDLQLNNFLEDSISNGWLSELSCTVTKLTIDSNYLKNIGKDTFANHPFTENNFQLTIGNSKVSYLQQDTFHGSKMTSLEFRAQCQTELNIEEDVFKHIADNLQILQFNGFALSEEAILNMTSKGTYLNSLETLALEDNIIHRIPKNGFSNMPKLVQIYLRSCCIQEIEPGAFGGGLKKLDLKSNNLKTLPEGLFSSRTSPNVLLIDQNPWKCDCSLEWLKNLFITRNIPNNFNCQLDDGTLKNYKEVEFCPKEMNNSTPFISSSTSTSKRTTIIPSITTAHYVSSPANSGAKYMFKKLFCTGELDGKQEENSIFMHNATLKAKDHSIEVVLYQNPYTPSYTVHVYSSNEKSFEEYLIWTNVDNSSDYGCFYNLGPISNIYVELMYDAVYTVCLATNDTAEPSYIVSRDCTAIKTPSNYENQTWIRNKEKVVVISTFIFCLLFTLLVASFFVYLIIRQNPQLIKGNKRVVLVKRKVNKKPSFLVMPHYEAMTAKSDGYLTPKSRRYSKIKHIYDCYDTNKLENNNNIYNTEKNNENIYSAPPHLPPNHPSGKRLSIEPYFHSNM